MKTAVLLATYNGEKYLDSLLESLLNQDYKDFTVYISDDKSFDNTLQIINEYKTKYPSKFVLLKEHTPTKSARSNFLYLLENVEADLFLFCDQDDVWKENHVSTLVEKYILISDDEKKMPVVVHADLEVVDEDLNCISKSFFAYNDITKYPKNKYFYCVHNNVTGCAMLINNSVKKYICSNIEVLRQNLDKIPMHDFFCAFIAVFFGKIYFVDSTITLYRQHQNNTVGAQNANSISYLKSRILNLEQQNWYFQRSVNFITFFCSYYENNMLEAEIAVLKHFCMLKKYGKLHRIGFIIKNGFMRDTLKRKIIQILTI